MSSQKEIGHVKWFDKAKGYGFITRKTDQGEEDVFVHYNAIKGEGFRLLHEGQMVEYILQKGPKGLQAEDVIMLDNNQSPADISMEQTESTAEEETAKEPGVEESTEEQIEPTDEARKEQEEMA